MKQGCDHICLVVCVMKQVYSSIYHEGDVRFNLSGNRYMVVYVMKQVYECTCQETGA